MYVVQACFSVRTVCGSAAMFSHEESIMQARYFEILLHCRQVRL